MFWQKKSEKRLPDLPPINVPPASSLPFLQEPKDAESEDDLEMLSSEKHELPSFPDSMNDKGFSQSAIKDAVTESEKVETGGGTVSEKEEKNFKAIEMEEWNPSIVEDTKADFNIANVRRAVPLPISPPPRIKPKFEEPPRFEIERPMVRPLRTEKNADVFVKLDKFYSARKALADVQQKLDEADELLRKIRETKMREEQELVAWEKELMTVKGRVNDINQNLFEKVD